MEKLKMHSPDLTQTNLERIREIFPDCVTETQGSNGKTALAVDFDQLKQTLSSSLVEGPQERYRLDWPGKREALLTANAPIAKTLRPAPDESVNFDTTQNLFIEGDNLDALKLLQESYLGKVKMIYIDPPYNTGNDFIYNDDFSETTEEFLKKSNQKDEDDNRLVANAESNGRFHSDWLSMIYPRLKLARNLLRDDGVIFISIDDKEIHTLRNIGDEIFGQQNFEGHIHWRRRHNQPNDKTKLIGLVAEHIICYSKNTSVLKQIGVGKVGLTGNFSNPDNDPKGAWASKPWKAGSDQSGSQYSIVLPDGRIVEEEWMGEEATYKELLLNKRIIFPKKGKGLPRKKYYKSERQEEGQAATNWWTSDQFGNNQEGNDTLTELMDGYKNVFSNPKPTKLLKNLITLSNVQENDIILDYFLGSATIFQAAFDLDLNIKIVGVQYPEALNPLEPKHKPGFEFCSKNKIAPNIAEISKERIRRAGKKILEGKTHENWKQDTGFRVLKVDSSNMAEVYYTPEAITQEQLEAFISNIKPDRSESDLVFQVLLDWGMDLTLPIRHETIEGKSVYFVGDDQLVACFDTDIPEELVYILAKKQPEKVVFRDSGFASDSVKINVDQIFKQLSPATEVRAI